MRILFLIFLITTFSSQLYAADQDECGNPEAMTEKLKAEGQRSFASAERTEYVNGSNKLNGMIFTVNDDRSAGYILESDKATDERATKICVYKKLVDLRLFDARKRGVPPEVLLKASDEDAMKHCAELIKSGKLPDKTCGPYNKVLLKIEHNGERVMFQGFNVQKQADGSYKKNNTLTTVTGNVLGSVYDDDKEPLKGIVSGITYTSLPDGATIINMTLIYAKYTPYGITLLEQK